MMLFSKLKQLIGTEALEDRNHEFHPTALMLERQPTSPWGRILFWLLCGMMLVIALVLYFGKVDVVVSASGEVLPIGNVQVIQPLEIGVIKKIYKKVGEWVEVGDVLFEMEPDLTEASLESVQSQGASVSLEQQRLKALMNQVPFAPNCGTLPQCSPEEVRQEERLYFQIKQAQASKEAGFQSQLAELQQRLYTNQTKQKEAQQQLAYVNGELQRLLPVEDLIPKKEIVQLKQQQTQYSSQKQQAQSEAQEIQWQIRKVESALQESQHQYQNDLHQQWVTAKRRMTELEATTEQSVYRAEKQLLKSPISGVMTHLNVYTEGAVVTPSEVLAQIVDNRKPVELKVSIKNKDIGLLKVGQPCRIKVDAYDFQKYGTLTGTLRHLSQNTISTPRSGMDAQASTQAQANAMNSAPFTAYITVENPVIRVGEKDERLKAGMAVHAEVKIGKRRLYELFFFPLLRMGQESFSVR